MTAVLFEKINYKLLDFDSEKEFEKAVIDNSKNLFGQNTVYIDTKKRIGEKNSYHKTIPDAFLIDFSNEKRPQLYFVENELSTHDAYGHIAEQLLRFSTSMKTSPKQIRIKLVDIINSNQELLKEITDFIKKSNLDNLDQLINYLIDNPIKIVLVINEVTPDLNLSLGELRNNPDVVSMQRYSNGSKIMFVYEPMREEIVQFELDKNVDIDDFDTIVCPAFEDGFKHAYIENDAWWAIRISQKAREQLKYLAIYEKSPVAAVRNFAEIDKIEPYKDSGKFIVYVKNKKTINPIELDVGRKGIAPQSSRYTTYTKLLKAKKISELWL